MYFIKCVSSSGSEIFSPRTSKPDRWLRRLPRRRPMGARKATRRTIVNAPATTVRSQDEAHIRRMMAERETAMRARDAERVVAAYAPDVVDFSLAPPLQQPVDDVRDVTIRRNWFAR